MTVSKGMETSHMADLTTLPSDIQSSMESSSTSLYDALPLDRTKSDFRLWRFCTTEARDTTLELVMEIFSMANSPPYISLSYEWGLPGSAKAIHVNNEVLDVTDNLYQFLVTMRETAPSGWFWADQISMNQADVQERNHQVNRMSTIYSNADEVHVWVGPESPTAILSNESLSAQLRPYQMGYGVDRVNAVLACLEIFARSYWTRLWIVQELRLARTATIWYGSHQIRASELYDAIKFFLWNRIEVESIISRHDFDQTSVLRKWRSISSKLNSIEAILGAECIAGNDVDTSSRAQDWLVVLRNHSHGKCKDPRDKIYGLQALVDPKYHIPIDYTRRLDEITFDVVKATMNEVISDAVNDDAQCLGRGADDLHEVPRSVEELSDSLDQLISAMDTDLATDTIKQGGLRPHFRVAQALLWSLDIWRIGHYYQNYERLGEADPPSSWIPSALWTQTTWYRAVLSAITPNQKRLASKLQDEAKVAGKTKSFKSCKQSIARYMAWDNKRAKFQEKFDGRDAVTVRSELGETRDRLKECTRRKCISSACYLIQKIIAEQAEACGFLMYGPLLLHPEDELLLGIKTGRLFKPEPWKCNDNAFKIDQANFNFFELVRSQLEKKGARDDHYLFS